MFKKVDFSKPFPQCYETRDGSEEGMLLISAKSYRAWSSSLFLLSHLHLRLLPSLSYITPYHLCHKVVQNNYSLLTILYCKGGGTRLSSLIVEQTWGVFSVRETPGLELLSQNAIGQALFLRQIVFGYLRSFPEVSACMNWSKYHALGSISPTSVKVVDYEWLDLNKSTKCLFIRTIIAVSTLWKYLRVY